MKCSKCGINIKYKYDLKNLRFKYIMDKNPKNPWPEIVKIRMNLIGECKKCKTRIKIPDFKDYVLDKEFIE